MAATAPLTSFDKFIVWRRFEIGSALGPFVLAWIASGDANISVREFFLFRWIFDGFWVVLTIFFVISIYQTMFYMYRASHEEVTPKHTVSHLVLAIVLLIAAIASWVEPSAWSFILSAAFIGIPWVAGMDIERNRRLRLENKESFPPRST